MADKKYGINLSLEELRAINKALKGRNEEALRERLVKAIDTIEDLKKRGEQRNGKRLQGPGAADIHKDQRKQRKMEPCGSKSA